MVGDTSVHSLCRRLPMAWQSGSLVTCNYGIHVDLVILHMQALDTNYQDSVPITNTVFGY